MDTLTRALSIFDADESAKGKRFTIDLACGSGHDTAAATRLEGEQSVET